MNIIDAAKKQYNKVGYENGTDGYLSLYVKGAEFGAIWQEEQHKEIVVALNDLLADIDKHYIPSIILSSTASKIQNARIVLNNINP